MNLPSSVNQRHAPGLAFAAAFLGWLFDGFEIGLFPLVARPALLSMAGAGGEAAVGHWMGIITAAFLLGAALGGFVFGWLGDRIGRVRAMAFSILCYSLFSAAGFFAAAPWQLGAARFLAALGMGGEWALGVALVMEVWPDDKRPLLAGAIGAASNLGMVLVAFVGRLLPVTTSSWRWIFLIGAAPALLTLFIRLFVPESHQWQASQSGGRKHSPLVVMLQQKLLRKTLLGIVLSSVALIGTWGSVQWIPLWIDQLTGGSDPDAKANAQLLSALGAALGSALAPVALGGFRRRNSYFLLCAASFVSGQLLFRTQHGYDATFIFCVFVTAAATASFYGWFPLYLPELFPTAARATGQGISYNSGRIVAACGTLVSGQLVAHYGGYAPMGAAITLIYVAGMIAIWFAPETHGRGLPE